MQVNVKYKIILYIKINLKKGGFSWVQPILQFD